jgi:hypothetical protein
VRCSPKPVRLKDLPRQIIRRNNTQIKTAYKGNRWANSLSSKVPIIMVTIRHVESEILLHILYNLLGNSQKKPHGFQNQEDSDDVKYK